MKPKVLNLFAIALFLLPLCITLFGTGCEKDRQVEEDQEELEWSDLVEGYICGTFICLESDSNGIGTNNWGERGYCILLEGSENTGSQYWPMDFYTFDIPEDLFNFPEEMPYFDVGTCGPYFFPDSLANKWKISFEYREAEKSEKIYFSCGPCSYDEITFRWDDYTQKRINNLKKAN